MLSEIDKQNIWHPYTQHQKTGLLPVIVKGEGVYLWDEKGKSYLDAISSWWVNPFGHSNPILAKAIYNQLTTLEHVLFGGFSNKPAVELSEKLLSILPENQKKIFFSDNGSTAVEVAIKVSLQYFFNKNEKKTRIIAFSEAFHGDTFGAMAASGISFFTEAFQGELLTVDRIDVPQTIDSEVFEIFEKMLSSNKYASFIFEPLVQGAAGMKMYAPEVLDKLISLCKKYNVFTIADEVMTGFGKTGKTFACDYLTHKPDMICLSKALTGGTIPMAITTFTKQIYDGFLSDDVNNAFFHGHTFTGNPTGCAAALAAIDLLLSKEIQLNIKNINQKHLEFEKKIKQNPMVEKTRVLGVIFALEIKTETNESYYGSLRNKLYQYFIANGIILRPVGNIIYILPPYIISNEELELIYQCIENSLNDILN